jgi:5-methylcytosine-specific restriction endonuclease McrA
MPCAPARARQLLKDGKAAVFRRYPFTIILKERKDGDVQPVDVRVDPGSKTTGLAVVVRGKSADYCVWSANVAHRGHQIREALEKRRAIRRGRRNRNTRYRQARFLNRARPKGWLPPSLMSRVHNIETWVKRLQKAVPISAAQVETARFDTQLMENPEISSLEYQRGTLFGFELREYLLYRHNHTCAYCEGLSGDRILEQEHVTPKSKRGSNRIANLVIACVTCNKNKGGLAPETWMEKCSTKKNKLDQRRAKNMERVLAGKRPSLRDAAAMNATRYAVGRVIKALIEDTTFWSGGRTKKNRTEQRYEKDHWIDAACVGERGSAVLIKTNGALQVSAKGHGSRQMCRMDRFGFPRTSAKSAGTVRGFQTGDIVQAIVTSGVKRGRYVGRVAVRATGSFNITSNNTVAQGISHRFCEMLHRNDGYNYT